MRTGATGVFVPVAEHTQELHRFVRSPRVQRLRDPVEVPEERCCARLSRVYIVQGESYSGHNTVRIELGRIPASMFVLQRCVFLTEAIE